MTMGKIKRVVVDECLGKAPPVLDQLRGRFGNRPLELVFLAAEHAGIPDVEILDKLMDARTALLTRDRVLHNRALDRGFRSFMAMPENTLTDRRLPRVPAPGSGAPASKGKISGSYVHRRGPDAQLIIGRLLRFFSEHQLKQFRTKRRRIRAHFGSAENIAAVALTVSHKRTARGVIGGYMLKVEGRHGVKGLDPASESYFFSCDGTNETLWAACWALLHVLVLQLECHPITLYHLDRAALTRCSTLLAEPDTVVAAVEQAAARLLGAMSSVRLMPCVKGRFFDCANKKLAELARFQSNELVSADFRAMAAALIGSKDKEPDPTQVLEDDDLWEEYAATVYYDEDWNKIPL
jgi:hypothetical protein